MTHDTAGGSWFHGVTQVPFRTMGVCAGRGVPASPREKQSGKGSSHSHTRRAAPFATATHAATHEVLGHSEPPFPSTNKSDLTWPSDDPPGLQLKVCQTAGGSFSSSDL